MKSPENPRDRTSIRPGMNVEIIQKQDQKTGRRTPGIVQEILTNSQFHPHGIKVRLSNGMIGRVAAIIPVKEPPAKKIPPQSLENPKDIPGAQTGRIKKES